jgi:hypothetical protein
MYKRSILYDQRFFQLQKKIVYHDMKGNKIIELNQNQTRKQEYKIAGAEKIITVIGISIICICVLVKIHPKKDVLRLKPCCFNTVHYLSVQPAANIIPCNTSLILCIEIHNTHNNKNRTKGKPNKPEKMENKSLKDFGDIFCGI